MRHRFKLQDLVSVGIYATIYFVIVLLATMLLRFTIPTFNSILIPSLTALFSGLLYLVVINKVPKFGAITILGSLMTLFFLVFSYFPFSFLPSFIFPFLADLLQNKTKLKKEIKVPLSYIVFNFGLTGPILPMWFMKEAYISNLLAKGKSRAYIEGVFSAISMNTFIIAMSLIIICSLIGLAIGKKSYAKHFKQ
ncbi:MptD family putative ECF transporter S component [Vagococcus sp.]|uniref:MptD family putative ECF transporter S component n=1 Tax=Vagococcus sp. TaxID=1933889 RepID=UPI003F9C3E3F